MGLFSGMDSGFDAENASTGILQALNKAIRRLSHGQLCFGIELKLSIAELLNSAMICK